MHLSQIGKNKKDDLHRSYRRFERRVLEVKITTCDWWVRMLSSELVSVGNEAWIISRYRIILLL